MADTNIIVGVYQLPNGFWAYRCIITIDGKRKDIKRTKDDHGNPFKTERAASRARTKMLLTYAHMPCKSTENRKTFADVYDEYSVYGRNEKAYTTIKKQDSLWKNHLSVRFGERFVDDVSVAEINDYLAELYYIEGRAYRYVESFLKMFYLIFGQAYSRNYLDVETYNKLCVNKDIKIRMPKMKIDEDTEIIIFNQEELKLLDQYFVGTNAETAYLLGKYCSLRINECYGLL